MDDELNLEPIVETDNYMVYVTTDEDGEMVYHVDVFNLTLHFDVDEWQEFVALIHAIPLKD